MNTIKTPVSAPDGQIVRYTRGFIPLFFCANFYPSHQKKKNTWVFIIQSPRDHPHEKQLANKLAEHPFSFPISPCSGHSGDCTCTYHTRSMGDPTSIDKHLICADPAWWEAPVWEFGKQCVQVRGTLIRSKEIVRCRSNCDHAIRMILWALKYTDIQEHFNSNIIFWVTLRHKYERKR